MAIAPLQATAQEAGQLYTVAPGDTLIGFGKAWLADPKAYRDVARLNGIKHPRRMRVGQILTVPDALLRFDPVTATIAAFKGDVTVEAEGRTVKATSGLTLKEGAVIATGAGAFMTLEFEDGSRTTLPSQSRLRLVRLRKVAMTGQTDRILQLEAGRSGSSVRPLTSPKDRYQVRTPLAVAAIRGTEFRVDHDPDAARSNLEVVEGKVGASTAPSGPEIPTPAGFGLSTTAAGVGALEALLPAPKLTRPDKPQDEPDVSFVLAPVAGAKSYRLQLANDAGFIDLFDEVVSPTPTIAGPKLADGAYFARFTASAASGLEGLPVTYAIERQLNSLEPGGAGALPGVGRKFLFKWASAGEGAHAYRFQLSAKEDGSDPLIDEPNLALEQIVVTDLPPGTYYWRVQMTRIRGGKTTERWTPAQRFALGGG